MFERLQAHLDQLHWKELAKRVVHRLGYSVTRIDPRDRSQDVRVEDPFLDQQRIVQTAARGDKSQIVFDVGANVGQSVTTYRALFPEARIHAFEPLPKAYRQLLLAADAAGNTQVNQLALHDASGVRPFCSNRGGANQTSSFLPPAEDVRHGYPAHAYQLEKMIEVHVNTLDAYCEEHGIEHIDVLKMDTQGTELDVLRGAERMLSKRAITLAYIEVVFTNHYVGNAMYHDIAAFLAERGYDLFRIYQQHYGTAGRHIGGDAVFIERSILNKYCDQHFQRQTTDQSAISAAAQAR